MKQVTRRVVALLLSVTLLMGLTNGDPSSAPWFDLSRVELRRDMVSTLPDMMFIGMDTEIGSIEPGKKADLVFTDDRFNIKKVMVAGEVCVFGSAIIDKKIILPIAY